MKKMLIAMALIAAATGTHSFAQTNQTVKEPKKETNAKVYACPMHPDQVSDKPGKCPKCGMKLEIVKATKKKK